MTSLKDRPHRFLRFVERYTTTDMTYLVSGSLWLMLGPAVTALLAFALSVAFANLLPEESYGTYRYILAIASVLSIATMAGMNMAITRAVAKGHTATVMPALARRIEWGLLGGLAAIGGALYYLQAGDARLALLFLLIAPFIPLSESFSLYQAVLAGLRDFRRSSLYLMVSQLAATVAVVLAILLSGNMVVILLAYFGAWTLARFAAFLIIHRHLAKGAADPATLAYGYHLSLMSAFDTIAAQADKMLIFHFLGAPALAGYAIALAIPDQAKALLKNALTVSFPSFSVSEPDDVRRSVRRASGYLFIPLAAGSLIYVLVAPALFAWLFPKYVSVIVYSQVYALVLLLVPKALHRIFFESHGKTGELYGFQAFSFVLKICLLATLIPLYGLWGALAALLLTELGVYIYLEIRIRRRA